MKEIKVGLKNSEITGLSFFGLDEVNAAIKNGGKVVSMKEGSAIMKKAELDDDNTRLILIGFSILVIVED
jgi:hypothetical protein